MKKEAVNHTKMGRLMRRLNLPRYACAGILELLWQAASIESPRGDIGKLTNEDIAIAIDWRDDPDALVDALHGAGWIDSHPDFRFVIHDWWEHAQENVHSRVARSETFFVCGTAPKLSGLNKKEREKAEKFYAESTPCSQAGISEARQDADSGRAVAETQPCLTLPNHALPDLTQPDPTEPNERAVDLELKQHSAEEQKSVRSFVSETPIPTQPTMPAVPPAGLRNRGRIEPPPVKIPSKLMDRVTRPSPTRQLDKERIEAMRESLYSVCRFPFPDPPPNQPPKPCKPPDDGIVLRCLNACPSASADEIRAFMRKLVIERKVPEGGPRSYAWFEAVIRAQFNPVAEAS